MKNVQIRSKTIKLLLIYKPFTSKTSYNSLIPIKFELYSDFYFIIITNKNECELTCKSCKIIK